MKFLINFKSLIISILWVCLAQSCTPEKSITHPQAQDTPIIIDSTFTSLSVNEQVLVSTKLSGKDLNKKDVKAWFKQNNEKVSQKKEAILIGNFRKYPNAWFYTQIINITNENQVLVADEFNRLRCDAFELYTIEDNGEKKWGSLNRNTSFSKYPLPFFTYALPFTIQPKDTLNLLIHTQRHFGVHEVNLNISNYENYQNTAFTIFFTRVFQLTLFMVLAITMFILGRVFHYKSMTYWGLGTLGMAFVYITTWGFIDPFCNFSYIGLSGSNVSVFAVMVCITPQLFLREWMKSIPKNENVFNAIFNSLFVISLFFTVCYLFPTPFYKFIQNTVNLSLVMIILTFLIIVLFFYYSLMAWIRAKINYLFIGLIISYTPFILSQTTLFSENANVFLKSDNVIIFFITIGEAYVGIYLLREKLVTRRKLEENLIELKETLEDIRKKEVATIGRNLHDNVGNILASVLGYLNLRGENIAVQNLVKEAITEIRFLSHNLVKNEDLPIKVKIERLTEHFNQFSKINYVFTDYSNNKINKISAEQQINLYFIIQELFTNTLKHSFATEVILQVFEDNKRIWITVEDDGLGMKNSKTEDGIGLKNIDTRAKLSGFKVVTDSSTQGTNTTIEIML